MFNQTYFVIHHVEGSFLQNMYVVQMGDRMQFELLYFDNVVIFSEPLDQHIDQIFQVQKLRNDSSATLNMTECQLLTNPMCHSGSGTISLSHWSDLQVTPLFNMTSLRSFQCSCNVSLTIVPSFARTAVLQNWKSRNHKRLTFNGLTTTKLTALKTVQ